MGERGGLSDDCDDGSHCAAWPFSSSLSLSPLLLFVDVPKPHTACGCVLGGSQLAAD